MGTGQSSVSSHRLVWDLCSLTTRDVQGFSANSRSPSHKETVPEVEGSDY
jgi:hypothetical protein